MGTDLVSPLEFTISAHLRGCDQAHVEEAIYGHSDARRIAAALDDLCRHELGAPVEDALFHQSSIGAVTGVRLADGRKVVIKAHQPDWSRDQLCAVVRLQQHVASACGLAPEVLAGPVPLGRGFAVLEALAGRGVVRDAHQPRVRRTQAGTLHRLVSCLEQFTSRSGLKPHVLTPLPGCLWPAPHSRLFDFDATKHGAEYIDRIARAARPLLEVEGRMVIAHGDWRIEHLRFEGDEPVAIFDWDSLCVMSEPRMLGVAAHMFCADWSRDDIAQAPTLDEARAFVADYEAARGLEFTAAERRTCGAAFAYGVAYTARCGHASGVDIRERPGNHQHLIAIHGMQLLEL